MTLMKRFDRKLRSQSSRSCRCSPREQVVNEEWLAILGEHDVPNSPVLSILDALNHPLVEERRLLRPQATPHGGTIDVSRHPVIYGTQLPQVQPVSPAPTLGEHSAGVVRDWLEETADYVDKLRAANVVG